MSDPIESETKEALGRLDIACWYRRVYALCQTKLLSAADAEDATQETFLRAVRRLGELRSPDALGAWLRSIAHHVCVDIIRKNRVRRAVADSPNQIATAEPAETKKECETDSLVTAIRELPEPLREVILLHYYNKMTYNQMADWLGVARSTVNDRLSRARATLKKQLARDGSLR